MSSSSSDGSDKGMRVKDKTNSSSPDEICSGVSLVGGGGGILKKGPWTSAEDAILVEYVKKHGEGNWNAVQKHSGLLRCGKSCRLRWANHLRPNLKKGSFTAEEEQKIIELHAQMGNKWARMATHLPGRTDNEIKNYWNTRIKRRQRAGLPLYPPNLFFQAANENHQSEDAGEFNSDDNEQGEVLQGNYDFSLPIFDNLKVNQEVISYAPNMIVPGFASQNLMNPVTNCAKRLGDPKIFFTDYQGGFASGIPTFDTFVDPRPVKFHQSFGFAYDPQTGDKDLPSSSIATSVGHAVLNGDFSTSSPSNWAVKSELPSLQFPETDLSGWPVCPSLPPETVDDSIQSPPCTSSMLQLHSESPRSSGLLESIFYKVKTPGIEQHQQSEKSASASVVSHIDVSEITSLKICDTEWFKYNDSISPLGCFAASLFNKGTPQNGSSLDECSHCKALSGSEARTTASENVFAPNVSDSVEPSRSASPIRPDALLGNNLLSGATQSAIDHSMLNGALATILGGDLSGECKGPSSKFAQGLGLASHPWKNVPPLVVPDS